MLLRGSLVTDGSVTKKGNSQNEGDNIIIINAFEG